MTIGDGHAAVEDVVLNPAEATPRFGADIASLIFDDPRPEATDLTYRTATLRYGAPAALIFPAGDGTQAPTVDDDGDDQLPALPLVDRVG